MSNKSNSSKIISPMISRLQDEIKLNKKEVVSKFWVFLIIMSWYLSRKKSIK